MLKKILKNITKVMTAFLSVILILLVVLAVYNFFSVKLFRKDYANFFGYTFFEVISGSMSPAIEKGDLILVDLDTDYEVGDIISFKSGNALVTHRIVEINGDTFVTKGDANNTVDAAINKDKIAGKVVKIFNGFGTWIKVVTTPKVMISIIMSIILVGLCFTYLKPDENEKKIVKEREDEEMVEAKNSKKLITELIILFVLLIALAVLIPLTLSRFKTEARSDAGVEIAYYCLKDSYEHTNITLDSMLPGDIKTYRMSVSNNDGTNRTEVNMKYDIEIVTTTNLPLTYNFYYINENSHTRENAVISDVIALDSDEAYFRTLKTSTRNFTFSEDKTDIFELEIIFPSNLDSSDYQNIAENIEIRVNSKQNTGD